MASPPDAGGSRYVGRVVDPDVREDGETEPEVELNPSPTLALADSSAEPELEGPEAPSATDPLAAEGSSPAASRGAGVRERLLAKARAADEAKAKGATGLDRELETVGRGPEPEGGDPAEFVAAPPGTRAPAAPLAPMPTRELSPTLVAIFASLSGIATIASLTALFMSLETRFSGGVGAASHPAAKAQAAASAPAEPKPKPKRQRQRLPSPWRVADAKGDPKYRFVEGKVGTDPFLKALEAAGVPEAQSYRVLAAMRGVVDLDKCKKTDRFQALLERGSNKLYALEYLAGPEEIYQAKEIDGRLTGSRLDLKIERAQITGALSYDGASFDRSADLFGFDSGLAKVVARALDGQMSLDELERGDVLKLVVQEVTALGDFSRYAGVEALELVRVDPRKNSLRLYYSDAPNIRGYYDRDGRAPFEGGWRKPIKDAPRTSPFNPNRVHPVLRKVMPHRGTDYGAPTGTPVGASSSGTVTFVGAAGASGNLVKVLHPGGVETGYAHLSRFADGLKGGDKVKRMQVIGYVGSTGRSTGPHLHFSASRDGTFFDAETLNLDGLRSLTAQERELLRPLIAKYDPMLDAIPMPERFAPLPRAEPEPSSASGVVAEDDGEDEPAAPVAAAADSAPATAVAVPATAVTAPAPPRAGGSSVYLSDKELLDSQSATDDGEVEE